MSKVFGITIEEIRDGAKRGSEIDLSMIKVLPIFNLISEQGNVSDAEMIPTFNLGVGMVLVVAADCRAQVMEILGQRQCDSYPIGEIVSGKAEVELAGTIKRE